MKLFAQMLLTASVPIRFDRSCSSSMPCFATASATNSKYSRWVLKISFFQFDKRKM